MKSNIDVRLKKFKLSQTLHIATRYLKTKPERTPTDVAVYGVEPQKTQNQSKTDTAMIFKYFYNFD